MERAEQGTVPSSAIDADPASGGALIRYRIPVLHVTTEHFQYQNLGALCTAKRPAQCDARVFFSGRSPVSPGQRRIRVVDAGAHVVIDLVFRRAPSLRTFLSPEAFLVRNSLILRLLAEDNWNSASTLWAAMARRVLITPPA